MIGDEGHLLNIDEEYIDPEDPCKPYVCKVRCMIMIFIATHFNNFQSNGLIQSSRECAGIDICTNGELPFIFPGQCCPTCGITMKVAPSECI